MTHSTRRKTPTQQTLPGFKPAQFINVDLEQSDRDRLKATPFSIDQLDEALTSLEHQGLSISVKFDQRNDCWGCWVRPAPGSANDGYILAGRGSTPSKAIKQALYIHNVILEQQWGADQGQKRTAIDD